MNSNDATWIQKKKNAFQYLSNGVPKKPKSVTVKHHLNFWEMKYAYCFWAAVF